MSSRRSANGERIGVSPLVVGGRVPGAGSGRRLAVVGWRSCRFVVVGRWSWGGRSGGGREIAAVGLGHGAERPAHPGEVGLGVVAGLLRDGGGAGALAAAGGEPVGDGGADLLRRGPV